MPPVPSPFPTPCPPPAVGPCAGVPEDPRWEAWHTALAEKMAQQVTWAPDHIAVCIAALPPASIARDVALLGCMPSLFGLADTPAVQRTRGRLALALIGQVTPGAAVSAAAWAVLDALFDAEANPDTPETRAAWRTVGMPLAALLTPDHLGQMIHRYVRMPLLIAPFATFWLGERLPDRGVAILEALSQGRFEVAGAWAQGGPYVLRLPQAPAPTPSPVPSSAILKHAVTQAVLAHALKNRRLPAALTVDVWEACASHPAIVTPDQVLMFQHTAEGWGWAWAMAHPETAPKQVRQALRAVTAHLLATDLSKAPDATPVLDLLATWSAYAPWQVKFIRGILEILAYQHWPNPDLFFNEGDYRAWAQHDLTCRGHVIKNVLAVLDMSHLPQLLHDVLSRVLKKAPAAFDDFWTQVKEHYVSPAVAEHSLLQQVVEMERTGTSGVDLIQTDLVSLTPPEQVGAVLVETLAKGYGLSPRFGAATGRWPLPVVACRARWAALPSPEKRLAEFDHHLTLALEDEDLPLALRERLFDACEAVRPHIAEDRFRARDRLAHLQDTPASEGSPRRTRA